MWAAGEATKYQPPNIPDFDGALDGSSTLSRPRGRTGPAPAPAPAPAPSTSTDQAIKFMKAFFAAQARNSALVPPIPATTGIVHAFPLSHSLYHHPPTQEIETFLVDFLRLKGINITGHQTTLEEPGITPDVIPDMSIVWTIALTGLLEGQAVKLQKFAEE